MSSIQSRIIGADKLLARLGELQNVVFPVVAGQLQEAALSVHQTAVRSIESHESSGRTYKHGSVSHNASAEGSPPNSDTGHLLQSIKFEIDTSTLTAVVGTNLKYGKYLEMGTSNIKPRPWLFPAFEMHRIEIMDNVGRAVREAIRGRSA